MSELNTYNHQIPIQIRFVDVDRLNHVNNSCYLSYFELARVCYFNDVFKGIIEWDKKGFVLARTELDHVEPIFLNDDLTCYTKVVKIGNKSLTIENSLSKKMNGTEVLCAKGIGVLVAFDYQQQFSIEIPEVWRNKLSAFETTLLR